MKFLIGLMIVLGFQNSFAVTGDVCILRDSSQYYISSGASSDAASNMCRALKKSQSTLRVAEISLLGATLASACGVVTLPATVALVDALVVTNILNISITLVCDSSEGATEEDIRHIVCEKLHAAGVVCDENTNVSERLH